MYKFEQTILNNEGQPIVGAQVSVFVTGTSTLATLYEDDQTTTKTNPLTSDATGFVSCKAINGKYDYLVAVLVNGSYQTVRRVNGVIFDDPSEGGNSGIALGMPGEFTVSGSPGPSITVTKKNQSANTFYAGPAAGVASGPVFRAVTAEDLPQATQAARGGVQLAAPSVVAAGTDTTQALAPGTLTSHWAVPKAAVAFNGVNGVVQRQNKNIATLTRSGTGRYPFTFPQGLMPDEKWMWDASGTSANGVNYAVQVINKTQTGGVIATSTPGASVAVDMDDINVFFYDVR